MGSDLLLRFDGSDDDDDDQTIEEVILEGEISMGIWMF